MSKKYLFLSLIALLSINTLQAQSKKKKSKEDENVESYFDESGGKIKDKLWYGGGFALNFGNNEVISQFTLGASPMVGYKILEKLSVGPRVALTYNYYRANFNGSIITAQPISYEIGPFIRYKPFRNFFAQSEYNFEVEKTPRNNVTGLFYLDSNNQFIINKYNRQNFLLGAGYNSGNGDFGYEILLLYNFLHDPASADLPFDIRFGFTYKF